MGISTRRKGQRNELRARKHYEAKGYIVAKVKGSTKYNRDVDFFSEKDKRNSGFDLICKKKNDNLYIQVKTNNKPKLDWYYDFATLNCCCHEKIVIVIFRDRKDARLIEINHKGEEKEHFLKIK